MRQLKEHFILPKIKYNYRCKYTNGEKPILEDNIVFSSFDAFCNKNDITVIDEYTYDFYLTENFNEDDGRSYSFYQYKLYESIDDSKEYTKDITNLIYNKYNGVVYHITDINTYIDNIKYKELKPKGKYNDEYRDRRIFVIADRNEKVIQRQLRSIFNTSIKIKHPIVLKIDLNKYKNRLRFRIDSSAFGYNAYFTEEPIPDYCITCLDLETWVNIDKKNIKT